MYSMNNIKVLYFNLVSLNFHKSKLLFIIFKLLFKLKQKYWNESDNKCLKYCLANNQSGCLKQKEPISSK